MDCKASVFMAAHSALDTGWEEPAWDSDRPILRSCHRCSCGKHRGPVACEQGIMLGEAFLHLRKLVGCLSIRGRLGRPLNSQSLKASSHCSDLRGHSLQHLGLVCHGACIRATVRRGGAKA